jgi:hypothetical protein
LKNAGTKKIILIAKCKLSSHNKFFKFIDCFHRYKQRQHQALQEEDEMYGANFPSMGIIGGELKLGDEDFFGSVLERSESSP